MAEDMRVLGCLDEIADAPREADIEDEQFAIWPDTRKTLDVFLALATQWSYVGLEGDAVRVGINYPSIEVVLARTNGIRRSEWTSIFENVQHMERAALKVFNDERQKLLERRAKEAEEARRDAQRNAR